METEERIQVLVCRVGRPPQAEFVPNKFETWQRLVKGEHQSDAMVQFVHLLDGVELICNEDGRLVCPPNCLIPGMAPVFKEEDYSFIRRPVDAAAPGTMGAHETFGTIALGRSTGNHKFVSLADDEIRRWTDAILLLNASSQR